MDALHYKEWEVNYRLKHPVPEFPTIRVWQPLAK